MRPPQNRSAISAGLMPVLRSKSRANSSAFPPPSTAASTPATFPAAFPPAVETSTKKRALTSAKPTFRMSGPTSSEPTHSGGSAHFTAALLTPPEKDTLTSLPRAARSAKKGRAPKSSRSRVALKKKG